MIILKVKRKNVNVKIKGESLDQIMQKLNTIKEINISEATQQAINKELNNNGFDRIEWIL